ncbi:hypothetical protein ABTB38_18655, partial [Acinetobacter baumannii]
FRCGLSHHSQVGHRWTARELHAPIRRRTNRLCAGGRAGGGPRRGVGRRVDRALCESQLCDWYRMNSSAPKIGFDRFIQRDWA